MQIVECGRGVKAARGTEASHRQKLFHFVFFRSFGQSGGFTVVELLVAIGIIMILSLAICPALSKARVAAQTARCTSNLRNLGTALLLCTQDNGGKFPRFTTTYWYDSSGWDQYLVSSLGKKTDQRYQNVFYCPFHRDVPDLSFANPSYELNTRLSEMPLASVPIPSDAVMLICGPHRKIASLALQEPMLFVDGHAATEKWPAIDPWTPMRNRGFQ